MNKCNTEIPDLETKIIQWANDRDLIEGTTAYCQLIKLREEVLEAEEAINNGNRKEIVLELGDCYVVLVNLASKLGMSLHVCGEAAYEKIKDRKGKMIDGTFVKESDLSQKLDSGWNYTTNEPKPAATPEPMPTGNGKTVILEVMQDLLSRDTIGQKKYGTSLKTHNGRNALMDAYQESLDQCMYLKQAVMEARK